MNGETLNKDFEANETLSETVNRATNTVTFDVGKNGKSYKLDMKFVPLSTLELIGKINTTD